MITADMVLEDRLEEVRNSPELRGSIHSIVVAMSIRSLDMLNAVVREHLDSPVLLGRYLRWMTIRCPEGYRDTGFLKEVVAILRDGLHERDNWGRTALHSCAKEWVPHLIAAGLDVNVKDVDGDTPLHSAVDKHEYDIRDVLLEYGADTGIRNRSGRLPLEMGHV